MDARTSRYHEVYARWQRDPQGFWAEAAADDRLVRKAVKAIFDPKAGDLRPLVSRRRLQHLLQRASTATSMPAAATRRRSSTIRRVAGTKRTITYRRLLTEAQMLAAHAARSRRRARATASSSTCRWCRRR